MSEGVGAIFAKTKSCVRELTRARAKNVLAKSVLLCLSCVALASSPGRGSLPAGPQQAGPANAPLAPPPNQQSDCPEEIGRRAEPFNCGLHYHHHHHHHHQQQQQQQQQQPKQQTNPLPTKLSRFFNGLEPRKGVSSSYTFWPWPSGLMAICSSLFSICTSGLGMEEVLCVI